MSASDLETAGPVAASAPPSTRPDLASAARAIVASPIVPVGEPPPDPPVEPTLRRAHLLTGQWGVAALAVLAGCAAWWFANRHALPLLYADARSHLTISRRLLDGPNHSLVQLGTVWLPLPHLLVAPFSMVAAWWRSGFAAFPVNLACLVIEAIALFRIVLLAGRSRVAAWIAVVVLLSNPGWLYLHTTALGEPVLFAAILATVAGLSGWVRSAKPYSGGELAVFCGLPASAAVLSRYDGWAMAFAGAVFVVVVAQLRWRQWRYSLRCLRGYAVLPLITAAWWCWFNFVNWGDPLEFQRGPYSAQAQQELLDAAGLLPDKGDLARSVDTYVTATLEGSGRYVLAAALLGAVAWAVVGRWRLRALAPWLLVVIPVGFYVLSLYTGQIALRLGDQPGSSMFNLRYGLQVLPGLAAMVGLGAALLVRGWNGPTRRWRGVAAAALCGTLLAVTTAGWVTDWRSVPVVAEGLQQRELGDPAWTAAEYLHRHAVVEGERDGLIMIDDSVNPMLPVIAADLDRVSAPFSGPRWERTLADPSRAEWLFVDGSGDGDAVQRAIDADPDVLDHFDEVMRRGDIRVYQRHRDEG